MSHIADFGHFKYTLLQLDAQNYIGFCTRSLCIYVYKIARERLAICIPSLITPVYRSFGIIPFDLDISPEAVERTATNICNQQRRYGLMIKTNSPQNVLFLLFMDAVIVLEDFIACNRRVLNVFPLTDVLFCLSVAISPYSCL